MAATGNVILDSFSPALLKQVMQHAKALTLPVRTALYDPDTEPDYVYFLTSGIASVVANSENGMSVEVEVIGREGMVGSLHILGPLSVPNQSFMQLPGSGLRVPLSTIRALFLESTELRDKILTFIQVQTLTISQIAGCHRMHAAEQRLARWLLMVQDRVGGETLGLTQEFLAEMLGTQRTTVTAVASDLQKQGAIAYVRGQIRILDRERLERVSCSCYRVAHRLLQRFYAMYTQTENTHEATQGRGMAGR